MPSVLNPLQIRNKLGRKAWSVPQPNGPAGWWFCSLDGENPGNIIVTTAEWPDEPNPLCTYQSEYCRTGEIPFIHASIARPTMPTYDDLVMLHKAVFPGFAYQVFATADSHVNIHKTALHLWGRVDGLPWGIPDFGKDGTI